ncbi:MAG: leucine-rich repeat domain-containing protein, partial [Lachnospiraceae bacterium]|nr:leucine-rich repeat domain-containing protein [Lachnospiraceae bacterium]
TEPTPTPTAGPTPTPTAGPLPSPTPAAGPGNVSTTEATPTPVLTPAEQVPEAGKTITDESSGASFIVTSIDKDNPTVKYQGLSEAAKNAKSVVIKSEVMIGSVKYKVTAIADKALKGTAVEKLTISDGIETIGNEAFANCKKLTSVKIGKDVTRIGNKAFTGCPKLKSVTIGKKVTSIGNSAFAKCTSLKKITIPASVKTLGSKAFFGCNNLGTIKIKTKYLTQKSVKAKAFAGTKANVKVSVPKGKADDYRTTLVKRGLSKSATVK